MRKYKFKGTDGNGGGFIHGTTEKEHRSMLEALTNEICKRVHSCIKCVAV